MVSLKQYQKNLEKKIKQSDDLENDNELNASTRYLKELPSRLGLFIVGYKFFLPVSIIISAFIIFFVLNIPKYDYIVEKRLGDHYYEKFSEPFEKERDYPDIRNILKKPVITDMEQSKEKIYLSTRGHGLQVLDKDNALWKTYDEPSTLGAVQNEIREINCQSASYEQRLWSLGFDGSISMGRINGDDIDFQSLFSDSYWKYISQKDITATLMIYDKYIIVGTSSKGAGLYNSITHKWQNFSDVNNQKIIKIIYHKHTLWFLTNTGVTIYQLTFNENKELYFTLKGDAYQLKSSQLKNLKVFDTNNAFALTIDKGCYIFQDNLPSDNLSKKWSEKLLGGEKISNLSQKNIQYTFDRHNKIVVVGENFGIVYYHTIQRRWVSLQKGKLPKLNGYDSDNNVIILASTDGVFVIHNDHVNHLLKGHSIKKVSLMKDGFIYLVNGPKEQKGQIGRMSLSGEDRHIIIGNSSIPEIEKAVITDVLLLDNVFWITTQSNGVFQYCLNQREYKLINKTSKGVLKHVKKIQVFNDKIIILTKNTIYQWNGAIWDIYKKGVINFKLGSQQSELWIQASDKSITQIIDDKSENNWFSGTCPIDINGNSVWACLLPLNNSSKTDYSPKIYFPEINKRKLYIYNIHKNNWETPLDISGKHKFHLFAPMEDQLYTLASNGEIYLGETSLLGGNQSDLWMSDVYFVEQEHGINTVISLYGKTRKNDYHPDSGKWTSYPTYPFLKKNEQIDTFLPIKPHFGGVIVKTSNHRLIHLKDKLNNSKNISSHIAKDNIQTEYFDGFTFWDTHDQNYLSGKILQMDPVKFSDTDAYLSGQAPDLSKIFDAWDTENKFYLVTSHYISEYNKKTHSWKKTALPEENVKWVRFNGEELTIITNTHISTLSFPNFEIKSTIDLPKGTYVKIDFNQSKMVLTMEQRKTRKVFLRINDNQNINEEWKTIPNSYSGFTGNLNTVSHIFDYNNSLWVFSPNIEIGQYTSGNWKNFTLPLPIQLASFWKGPNDQLFLVGRRKNYDHTDVPLYYLDGDTFNLLNPLPSTIKKARIEKQRYLWIMADNGDVFIYDLNYPHEKGLSITDICLNAIPRITTSYSFNFFTNSFIKEPVGEKEMNFIAKLTAEEPESIDVYRDHANGSILKFFITTRKAILCFEYKKSAWYLTSEYRLFCKKSMSEALKKTLNCSSLNAFSFYSNKTHFKISVQKGYYPIKDFLNNYIVTRNFMDSDLKPIDILSNASEVKVNSVIASIKNNQCKFYVQTMSGMKHPVSHSNKRLEIDTPYIDASIDSAGNWNVLRDNSLTVYSNSTLNKVVEYFTFKTPVHKNAIIYNDNEQMIIDTPNRSFSIEKVDQKVHLKKYNFKDKVIFSNSSIKIIKKRKSAYVYVNGDQFKGNKKFIFDQIRQISTAHSKLYIKTPEGIWAYNTISSDLEDGHYYKFSNKNQKNMPFKNCSENRVFLMSGDQMVDFENGFRLVHSDLCFKPEIVASEKNCRWKKTPGTKGIFFEVKVQEKWKRLKSRQTKSRQFINDIYTWIINYNDRIYASHGMGIVSFNHHMADMENCIIGRNIKEIKYFDHNLYALDTNKDVYKLSGKNQWELNTKYASKEIFDEITSIYSDPLLNLFSRHKKFLIKTSDGQVVHMNRKYNKFSMDMIKDFIPKKDRLYVVNDLNKGIICYHTSGRRVRYDLRNKDIVSLERLVKGPIIAVASTDVYKMDSDDNWVKKNPNVNLANYGGLIFQKNLVRSHVQPVIDHHVFSTFWESGRFYFDQIYDIEAEPTKWWARTPSYLIRLNDMNQAFFDTVFRCQNKISKIKFVDNQLNVMINRNEKYLNTQSGKFESRKKPVFTRNVFDFIPNTSRYLWNKRVVKESSSVPTFNLKNNSKKTDIFYDNHFFWDLINGAAYNPETKKYWIITPHKMVINTFAKNMNHAGLVVNNFSMMKGGQNLNLVDAIFHKNKMYILSLSGNQEQIHRKDKANRFILQKKDEYPFWNPAVEFNLRDNIWKDTRITYSEYKSINAENDDENKNFIFIGPEDYPLFTELEWAKGFGKFSFDYIQSIHPVDNIIWAASKGGFVKFRFQPLKKFEKIAMEKIMLPEDGLKYYDVNKIKIYKNDSLLSLLESDNEKIFIQDFQIPFWKKIQKNHLKKQERQIGSGPVHYLIEYDPVYNKTLLSIKDNKNQKFVLLECFPLKGAGAYIQKNKNGSMTLRCDNKQFSFLIEDDKSIVEFHEVASNNNKKPVELSYTNLLTDFANISWGKLSDNQPAIKLPSGAVLTIHKFVDAVQLIVNNNGLKWIISDGKQTKSFHFNYHQNLITETKQTTGKYKWIKYQPKPGEGISHYLVAKKFIKSENIITKIFGRKKDEMMKLEELVKLIAQKNNIPKGSKGKLDYQLQSNHYYLMPEPMTQENEAIAQVIKALVIDENLCYLSGNDNQERTRFIKSGRSAYAYAENYFMIIDFVRNRIFLKTPPAQNSEFNLWLNNGHIYLSSLTDGKQSETWQYLPEKLYDKSSMQLSEFKRVYYKESNLLLEAAKEKGFIVNNGFKQKHILKSSEFFYGTKLSKVIDIQKDNQNNGYWIATQSSGLIWCQTPY